MSLPTGTPLVVARKLGYSYAPGRFAIRGLDLDLLAGRIVGLLGRNGAGKTTTIRVLTTLLLPTEGSALLFGTDARRAGREVRRRMGVVLQSESLDFVSLERNLTLYAFLWGVPREVAKARAEEMIELFELGPMRTRKVWALSGGERRRFQVARELMHDMDLLFLDEPTVGLDALTRRKILKYLRARAQGGLGILFTTHILDEADQLCDSISVLHQGRLLVHASPAEIKARYGGGRTVEVEFGRPLDGQEAALRRRIIALGVGYLSLPSDPGKICFRAANAEDLVAELMRWARETNTEVERLSVRETSLEEAFVGLVQAPTEPDTAERP
ncbi:MAG: ABC transporter ATP-binding protein [Thermoplasmata archaeon]|nr:ABC transporter ATP-binding protein [Thermoplasmata archaeon]